MDNANLQRIKELIGNSKSVAIAVGNRAGLDEMAAALGLYLTLGAANKQVSIASAVEPTVAVSSLVGIDKVRPNFDSGTNGDLVVSFPYREGEIEKVSYTIDNGFLNIVVKAGEQGLAFNEQDVLFKRAGVSGAAIDVLFVLGTQQLSDLGTLFNPEVFHNTRIVNIDNKAGNQGFGDLVFVSPQFSSVSEQIADIVTALNFEIDIDIAQNLMSGISHATGNLQSPTTSSLAFEMVGILMRKGAVRDRLAPVSPVSSTYQPSPFMQQPQEAGMGVPPLSATPPPMPTRMPQQRPQPAQRQPMPQAAGSQNVDPQISRIQQQIQQTMVQQPRQPFGQQLGQQPLNSSSVPQQENNDTPPSDWLTPKVYKGSTSV